MRTPGRMGGGMGMGMHRPSKGASGPRIVISNASIAESATNGTAVGTLSMVNAGAGPWTYTEIATTQPSLAVASGGAVTTVGTLNFESAPVLLLNVRATDGVDNYERLFAINVTNVLEGGTLNALTLDVVLHEEDAARTSTFTNRLSGSTLSVSGLAGGLPTGMTLNSGAGTITGTPTTPGTYNFIIDETKADSVNGPTRSTPLTITITEAVGAGATAIIGVTAGQSNARTAATDPANVPARYTGFTNVFMWIDATGVFEPYVAGTNSGHLGAEEEWGAEAEFIHLIRAGGDNRPIYWCKEAVNGQVLDPASGGNWYPTGVRFNSLEDQVAAMRAWIAANTAHTEFDEVAIYNQGEADADGEDASDDFGINATYMLSEWRARIQPDAFFIFERIRPLGYGESGASTETAGYSRAYRVREGYYVAALADGNTAIIDLDFDEANFPIVHPPEPAPWDENSWTTQRGKRAYAAWKGTYNGTYGDIWDAVPSAFTVPNTSGTEATTITSASVAPVGFERRAAVSLPAGVEMRILNKNGSLNTDWTNTPGFINKFQTFEVRADAPADGVTDDYDIIIGGVTDTWSLTGEASSSYRADTTALIAAAEAASVSWTGTQKGLLDDFYQAGEDDGWMALLERMILPLGSESASKLDLINLNTYTQSGGTALPWTSTHGWRPTNSNQRLVSGFSPSSTIAQNSICVGAWIKTLGNSTALLATSTDGTVGLRVRSTAASIRAGLHSPNVNLNVTVSSTGFYQANRSASAAVQFYGPAGTSVGTQTTASAAPTATDWMIGNSGATDQETGVGGVWIGASMDATQTLAFRNALVTLLAGF